jgi:hypothetical protein
MLLNKLGRQTNNYWALGGNTKEPYGLHFETPNLKKNLIPSPCLPFPSKGKNWASWVHFSSCHWLGTWISISNCLDHQFLKLS